MFAHVIFLQRGGLNFIDTIQSSSCLLQSLVLCECAKVLKFPQIFQAIKDFSIFQMMNEGGEESVYQGGAMDKKTE